MKTKSYLSSDYKLAVESLKTERDELHLKMHLASMEIQEEWQEVEKKWDHVQSKAHQLSKASGESVEKAGEAFSVVSNELKEAYRRIKAKL